MNGLYSSPSSLCTSAYKRTELLLAGHSKPEVIAAIKSAIEKKELPALEPGSVCYMLRWNAGTGHVKTQRQTAMKSMEASLDMLNNWSATVQQVN